MFYRMQGSWDSFNDAARPVNSLQTAVRNQSSPLTVAPAGTTETGVKPVIKADRCRCMKAKFASHLLLANYDIRTIQELLGHGDLRTTMIYTHTVQSRTIKQAKNSLDF